MQKAKKVLYTHQNTDQCGLQYYIILRTRYRKSLIPHKVEQALKEICLEISARFEIEFLEIAIEKSFVHFMFSSIPSYSPEYIVDTIKRLTAQEIFKMIPELKDQLLGDLWDEGYFMQTVSRSQDTKNHPFQMQRG